MFGHSRLSSNGFTQIVLEAKSTEKNIEDLRAVTSEKTVVLPHNSFAFVPHHEFCGCLDISQTTKFTISARYQTNLTIPNEGCWRQLKFGSHQHIFQVCVANQLR